MKRGISLIAVLMFMLAATTASIVLFRWIGQENFSSGSRLKNSEAYQASQAGLESVRGWLANKGAEAGMLLKIFQDNGGNPVHLNPEDSPLLENISRGNQKFDVYLTGIDLSKQPYKLKFLSIGIARDESRYSQAGIFEVGGLYQITVPKIRVGSAQKPTAYHGGIPGSTQNEMSSAIIQGNIKGSGLRAHGDVTITGNAEFVSSTRIGCGPYSTARNIGITTPKSSDLIPKEPGDFYVKGDYKSDEAAFCGNVYIDGNFRNNGVIVIFGDLHVEGNLDMNQELLIHGNATVNGNIIRSSSNPLRINGNLVMPNEASVLNTSANGVNIYGDAWIKGNLAGSNNSLTFRSRLYMDGVTCAGSVCARNGINFFVQGTYEGYPDSDNRPEGASLISHLGDQITLDPPYNVPDPIILGMKDDWLGTRIPLSCPAALRTADIITLNQNTNTRTFIDNANDCYKNGDSWKGNDDTPWLVLQIEHNSPVNNLQDQTLDGNFIIIVHNKPSELRLPKTTEKSNVLLYLTKGATTIHTGNKTAGVHFNYFIYSEEDIDKLDGSQSLNGTLFMANGKKVGSMSDAALNFNEELYQALSDAGAIVNNPDRCKGTAKDDGNGGCIDEEDNDENNPASVGGRKDSYYIPLTQHLRVNLQSQYHAKNEADLKSADIQSPSQAILVMPRVIYLNKGQNPRNYYSVLYLNGARGPAQDESERNPDCSTDNYGIYECSLTSNFCAPGAGAENLCRNSFYVFVKGDAGLPEASLRASNGVELKEEGNCTEISVEINEADGSQIAIEVNLEFTNGSSNGWSATKADNSQAQANSPVQVLIPSSNAKAYKICLSGDPDGNIANVFFVNPQGYIPGSPSFLSISKALKTIKIMRQDPASYGSGLKCPSSIETSNWLRFPACNAETPSWLWSCAGSSANWFTDPPPGCETYYNNSSSQESGTLYWTEQEEEIYIAIGLRWKKADIIVSGGSVTLQTTNPDVPAAERQVVCNGSCSVYQGVPYIVSSNSGPRAWSCSPEYYCEKTTSPVSINILTNEFSDNLAAGHRITATGNTEISLSQPPAPSLQGCILNKPFINSGQSISESDITPPTLSGYGCDAESSISYYADVNGVRHSLGAPISAIGSFMVKAEAQSCNSLTADCGELTVREAGACAYEESWCNGTQREDVIKTGANGSTSGCYFLTGGITQLQSFNNARLIINGAETAQNVNCWDKASCDPLLGAQMDGGWYIYVPQYNGQLRGTGGEPECGG